MSGGIRVVGKTKQKGGAREVARPPHSSPSEGLRSLLGKPWIALSRPQQVESHSGGPADSAQVILVCHRGDGGKNRLEWPSHGCISSCNQLGVQEKVSFILRGADITRTTTISLSRISEDEVNRVST